MLKAEDVPLPAVTRRKVIDPRLRRRAADLRGSIAAPAGVDPGATVECRRVSPAERAIVVADGSMPGRHPGLIVPLTAVVDVLMGLAADAGAVHALRRVRVPAIRAGGDAAEA